MTPAVTCCSRFRKKPYEFLLWLVFLAMIATGCSTGATEHAGEKIPPPVVIKDTSPPPPVVVVKTYLKTISQELIKEYALRNPCYLPLSDDTTFYQSGFRAGFTYEELFNEKLPADHPYRNRYLVGDFNVLDKDSNNRGVIEIDPQLMLMHDFKDVSDTILKFMNEAVSNDTLYEKLEELLRTQQPDDADPILNFFNKVWKYKTPPIVRKYGVAGSSVYAAGQHLCMCEAYEDTLMMVGRFAISGRRQTMSTRRTPEGRTYRVVRESPPINNLRYYYAGRYRISSKNWESQRKYEPLDIYHDSLLGGGNNQVTYFQGRVQLPNFLLMHPVSEYPEAMRSNGIHEVALSELSRGMLGSPNSIGCIRVTDFGSKFLRWWTPQDCNFFILYDNNRYICKLDSIDAETLYPFKTKEEGDRFRRWINEQKPLVAKSFDIDPEGDHKNGFVIDAYTAYKNEYEEYLKSYK